MERRELKLEPVERRFKEMSRGKYQATVERFMENGAPELNVRYDDTLQNAYVGLRRAIAVMGLQGVVVARKRRPELHLIRVG